MPSVSSPGADVTVVGGGAVGVCIAAELARRGAAVTLLERGPELAWGASAGNAGIVGPAHIEPLANPQALLDGLRWLGRPAAPFALRPRPAVVPWLARFVAACTPARVRRSTVLLRELGGASARLHAELAAAGLDTGYAQRGFLNVHHDRSAFEKDRRLAEAHDGLRVRVFEGPALKAAFPQLAGAPAGGVLFEDDAHCDPSRFVRAVGEQAVAAGARVRTGVEVVGLRRTGARVDGLTTTAGDLRTGHVVMAAGVWSGRLVRELGLRLPLEGGKGYHVDLERRPGDLELPVWFQDQRVVVTPLPDVVRVAGTLELAGLDDGVDRRRLAATLRAGHDGVTGLAGRPVREIWRGLRPCSPDGLPIIGPAPERAGLTIAAGHGMWGLQLAPVTARLVAGLLTGEAGDARVLDALSPARFTRARTSA